MPGHPALAAFHPAVAGWFARTFPSPTEAQQQAWPAIARGRDTLVAAPTGSGKTLTAFLAGIDGLVRDGLSHGLPDATLVLYISPLKALSNDIHVNLELPLQGIREELAALHLPDVEIRAAVRTGDTPQAERSVQRKRPPHILATTPESLYVLLGSESGRAMLAGVRSVIVDEIHALVPNKRGSHLMLSLERLDALVGQRVNRIGLSATQQPIEAAARYLVGTERVDAAGVPDCTIIDIGHGKRRDLALELPLTPLAAVASNDQWEQVYDRLQALAATHRTTLVFVNTRRMAERAARHLSERLGKEHVAAHHGSLSRELRLDAEQRLKRGELTVLVATASLELGIDIGDVDLVCQLGSPRSIAAFLQRVGRAGHHVGGVPKGRLFPGTRDDLLECSAMLDAIRRGELDQLRMPEAPLDVLAQSIVAEVANRDCDEDALFALVRRAWPYRALERGTFDAILQMLAQGYASRFGTRGAWVHRDAVNRQLRGRKGARQVATQSGGTIPDVGDYTVLLEPQAISIGTINEDFAIESLAGDIFQLGNASYRILKIEPGKLRVEDAQGAPPSIPFWLGEAPGRTDALSHAVSRLRADLQQRLAQGSGVASDWLLQEVGLSDAAAEQLLAYCAEQLAGFGLLPTQQQLAMERFFDEAGSTHLVIHAPFGSRINKAWGLALRKRFCRSFNFELQAAATENAIVLSLSTSHSFPLIDVASFLHSASAREVLVQALLDAPLFPTRFRWNATTALALPRFSSGKKVAPQLQRMKSEDLLATVFPDQVACLENIAGDRQVPDHPLVQQTLDDCLLDAMDTEGWLAVLRGIESGAIDIVARDLTAPTVFAAEALNAAPYAFLDDAPLEERRTQAVQTRGFGGAAARDLGVLDAEAIAGVREDAWPAPRDADEMHETLMQLGAVTAAEAARDGWEPLLQRLAKAGRATLLSPSPCECKPPLTPTPLPVGAGLWAATERVPQLHAVHPGAPCVPAVRVPDIYAVDWTREDALRELLRGRLSASGPVRAVDLAALLQVDASDIAIAAAALEVEGTAMRGMFDPALAGEQWCERHLLARIHRNTLGRLRREIEPVSLADAMRFLCDWQHASARARLRGPDALPSVLAQLEGWEAPASSWEADLLPARLADYAIDWLDAQCSAGRIAWTRLRAPAAPDTRKGGRGPVRATPLVLLPRRELGRWTALAGAVDGDAALSSRAHKVMEAIRARGALFFDELEDACRLLHTELEDALAELVARGCVTCDSFAGLHALLLPQAKRPPAGGRRLRRGQFSGIRDAGRWTLARQPASSTSTSSATVDADSVEHVARVLLRRYGVVCWRLLEREADWLPPWRELVRVYRRMEAAGELRGGRFIAGLAGEQYALPEAVAALRGVRNRAPDGEWIVVAASDPLNLVGTLLPGEKLPRQAGARLLLRDGVAVARKLGTQVELLAPLAQVEASEARQRLLRDPRLEPARWQPAVDVTLATSPPG